MKHFLLLFLFPLTFSGGAESVQFSPAVNLSQLPDEQLKK
jgi:hypothetical protein